MAIDWVKLFNLELAARLGSMDRATLTKWVDDNRESIREQSRKRRAKDSRFNLGTFVNVEILAGALAVGDEGQWDDLRRSLDNEEPFEEVRASIAEAAATLEECELRLDYWGCDAGVFGLEEPPGSVSNLELFAVPKAEWRFRLLKAVHVDQMLQSLRTHRAELSVMDDNDLARLESFRDRCRQDPAWRVAYFVDF